MAIIREFTPEEASEWAKWVRSRPPTVRDLCERFPPNRLFRLKSTGDLVTVHSWCENGTITVDVTAEFNAVLFERNVFGISPDDMEECDIPGPEVVTGALMSADQVDENIDALRCMIRPDLFIMGSDGKAVRKN